MIRSFLSGQIQEDETWRPQATHTLGQLWMKPNTFADKIMFWCRKVGNTLVRFRPYFSVCFLLPSFNSSPFMSIFLSIYFLLFLSTLAKSFVFMLPLVTWHFKYLQPSSPKHPFNLWMLTYPQWWLPSLTKIKVVTCPFWPDTWL